MPAQLPSQPQPAGLAAAAAAAAALQRLPAARAMMPDAARNVLLLSLLASQLPRLAQAHGLLPSPAAAPPAEQLRPTQGSAFDSVPRAHAQAHSEAAPRMPASTAPAQVAEQVPGPAVVRPRAQRHSSVAVMGRHWQEHESAQLASIASGAASDGTHYYGVLSQLYRGLTLKRAAGGCSFRQHDISTGHVAVFEEHLSPTLCAVGQFHG